MSYSVESSSANISFNVSIIIAAAFVSIGIIALNKIIQAWFSRQANLQSTDTISLHRHVVIEDRIEYVALFFVWNCNDYTDKQIKFSLCFGRTGSRSWEARASPVKNSRLCFRYSASIHVVTLGKYFKTMQMRDHRQAGKFRSNKRRWRTWNISSWSGKLWLNKLTFSIDGKWITLGTFTTWMKNDSAWYASDVQTV